jgi:hypothetical protein
MQSRLYVRRIPTDFSPSRCHNLEKSGSKNGFKYHFYGWIIEFIGGQWLITVTQPNICQKGELKWKKLSYLSRKRNRFDPLCEMQAGEKKIIETVAFGSRKGGTPCELQIPCISFEEWMPRQFSCRLFWLTGNLLCGLALPWRKRNF